MTDSRGIRVPTWIIVGKALLRLFRAGEQTMLITQHHYQEEEQDTSARTTLFRIMLLSNLNHFAQVAFPQQGVAFFLPITSNNRRTPCH